MVSQYSILLMSYVLLPEITLALLCEISPLVYVSCDSCCGSGQAKYCCEDATTGVGTTEKPSDWWIVGVCGAVSLVVVIIFIVVLFICTKKKIQRRFAQPRDNVIQVEQFFETSFSIHPRGPPPYTERPPSYTSQRARSARRYRQNREEDGSTNLERSDVPGLQTGRPPDYTAFYSPEVQTSQENSSQINTNRTTRLQGNIVSPPPPYSRHTY